MKLILQIQRGFSLIELMITVFIIGILASVAIPNYVEHIKKSRRAEAQSTLLQTANWLERYFTENNRYDLSATPNTAPTLPTALQTVPSTALDTYYNISVTATSTTYTIQATRTAAGKMADDQCGDFTYTSSSVKGIVNSVGNATAHSCWAQ